MGAVPRNRRSIFEDRDARLPVEIRLVDDACLAFCPELQRDRLCDDPLIGAQLGDVEVTHPVPRQKRRVPLLQFAACVEIL